MTPASPWRDVRGIGFAGRIELEQARAMLDALLTEPCAEPVPLDAAIGRTTAAAALAPLDLPARLSARSDGYALPATATYGASSYAPIETCDGLVEVAAGAAMPAGSDAVLGYGAAVVTAGRVEIVEPVAPGEGVMPAGGLWAAGATVIPAGRRLDALDVARAAEAGVSEITVWRRPRIALLVAGTTQGGSTADPLELLLDGLVARDGAIPRRASALASADGADLALVAGRTGCGTDDDAAPRLAASGRMLWHGLAIAPGGSAGLGAIGDMPVILLPGEPFGCLAAYELVAGPAVRRLAGLDPALPHARATRSLAAKIASRVGTTELWLVAAEGEKVRPLAHPDLATLATTAPALGFVLVPAGSEGWPAGAEVEVHLLGGACG